METFFHLLFTSTFIAIAFSLFAGYLIYLLIVKLTKIDFGAGITLLFSFAIYMFILYTPLPNVLNVELIKKMDNLEYNHVKSSGMINRILFACYGKDIKGIQGVRGYLYADISAAYRKDIESLSMESQNLFKVRESDLNNKIIEDGDICYAANYYNDLKNKRLNID